jgi:hypothetical protein
MDLTETDWENVGWIHLAQVTHQWWAIVNMVKNLQVLVPWKLGNSGKLLVESCES